MRGPPGCENRLRFSCRRDARNGDSPDGAGQISRSSRPRFPRRCFCRLMPKFRREGAVSSGASMQFVTKIDLKFRLALRVAAISAFCLVAALAFLLFDHDRAAQRALEGGRGRGRQGFDPATGASALGQAGARRLSRSAKDRAAAHVARPLHFLPRRGRRSPAKPLRRLAFEEPGAGGLSAGSTGGLFDPGAEIRQPVVFEGRPMGAATAAYDPASQIAQIWRETSRFLALMAVTLSVLCLLVYAALARALRPTRLIRNGLERLAANDLAARLPAFDLAELSAIRTVFNGLAEKLETTLAERRALTRKLIAVQDEERRRLARDLHDEFGQCLAAIGAVAASMEQTARVECPAARRRMREHRAHRCAHDGEPAQRADPAAPARTGRNGACGEPRPSRRGLAAERRADAFHLRGARRFRALCRPSFAPICTASRKRRSPMPPNMPTPRMWRCASPGGSGEGGMEELELTVTDDGAAGAEDLAVRAGPGTRRHEGAGRRARRAAGVRNATTRRG